MENLYKVNNSKGVIGLISGLKSRITSTKPVLTLMLMLMVGVGNAWATLTGITAVPKGKGTATVELYTYKLIGSDTKDDAKSSTSSYEATVSGSTSRTYYRYCKFSASAATGYTFDAWYTNTACDSGEKTGSSFETSNQGKGDRTDRYYAKFTPNSYTVKFNANTGSGSMSNQGFTYDAAQNLTANSFTKTGYTFAGWAKSKDGDVAYSDGQSVENLAASGEVTLYAKWTPNTYYVAFNGNGSTSGSMPNQTLTYDKSENLNAFANFERIYTVSYNANGGITAETSETNTKAEYEFVNWKGENDKSYANQAQVSNLTSTANGTFTLYAQWNSDFVKLPNATKDGGVLDAWYLGDVNVEANRVGAAGDNYTPTGNVTLTAKWIDKYTPEFTFNKSESDRSMKVGDALANAFTFNHTSNPTVHISPAGVITYDASSNKVTAVGAGEATIYFTQAGTSTILPGESDHWTFKVTRVANTLALTSNSATRYVDGEVTGIITTKNSDATVQTSSSDTTIAYYDVKNNKIVIPNNEAKSFTSTEVTITIWQKQNVKYEASDELTFTLTVNKYPSSFTGSDYNLMVDGTQMANYVYTYTSANQPTANSSDNFYYTIDEESLSTSVNKGTSVVTFNPANKQITACNAGTAKITLHQKETYKHTAAEESFNVAVYKYNSVFAGTSAVNVKVEADATSPYTLTYTKPNNSYISTESVAEGTPSLNSGEYYYTLTHNVTATNTDGSSDATKAIAYVAGTKTVTGKNAGTATVHLYQTETYKFNPADVSFNVNVTKNENKIYVKGSDSYSSSIYRDSYDNGLTITATNTDYANYPIQVTQTAGEDVATYYPNQNAVYSSYKTGTATWSLSQPENYRYLAASGSFSVTVVQQAEATCYVLANQSNQEDGWHGNTYHEHTWDAENVAGVVKFDIYRTWGVDMGYNVQQLLNGSWQNITDYKDDFDGDWQTKTQELNPAAKGVRFRLKGGSLVHVKNVSVTRKTYLRASDMTIDKKSDNTPVYPGETGVGTLKIDYSMANGGNLKISNDNPSKFSLSQTEISASDCNGGSANITIQYTSATAGTDVAHLVIYNNVYRKEVTITGVTVKHTPTVTWSSEAEYFNVEDVLSATNANGLTVNLSSVGNESYISCSGNTATMLEATDGKITITAHVTGNDLYADADFTKDITITNKEKQYITWEQDFSRLKTTDGNKSIVLSATSSSELAVSYELVGDKTGLSLTQNGNVWTLTYSDGECKNTTIVAKQGGDDTYAPASSVSKTVKVIDPTKVCDDNEVLVNSRVSLTAENLLTPASVTYNIDIPASMTVSFSRIKDKNALGWDVTYLLGIDVVFYSERNGTGDKLYTKSYSADDINKSLSNGNIDLADYIHAKSVKFTTSATNGYYIDALSYTHQKYCKLSSSTLTFETYPNTKTAALNFNVDYANYPITLECSNNKFTVSPTSFGDCSEYGTQQVSVSYTAGAAEGEDVGYLYIKDNTSATLKTCTLNVTISKVAQSITNTNIQNNYLTTGKVTLTAEANSGLTDFTYSASPAGIASFNGSEMTFVKGGTIAITVNQAGNNIYRPTSTTVQNVVVSKATPEIATNPTGTSIAYNQTLNQSTLSGGAADITLRGVANTPVEGSFAWTNPTQKITDNAGSHNYSVTFTPTDGNMYNTKEFTIPIIIARAEQTLSMNEGEVKVAVEGIDAGSADSKIDLDDLIASQSSDVVNEAERTGSVSYAVVSENAENATIGVGNVFSATATGEYTIRATKAETDYYAEATADFTVTVDKRANTLAIANTAFEKYVDEEVTAVRSAQNSDAQVQTSSDFPTIAYYDVDANKIVIPNSEGEEQMFGSQKTVTIKIWQDATDRFEASGEKTITLMVKKYPTTITGTNQVVMVNGSKTADYAFTNTVTAKPSSNLSDEFYYTIDEPNYENAALNNGEGLITFDPNTNVISGLNAGTTKITFYHKETRTYTGTSLICNIAVEKKANEIANTWKVWQKAMSENTSANVSFSSIRGDYANCPIAIERVYGEDVASLSGDALGATITTNTTHGYAIWHLSQAENYAYYGADADLMVTVGVPDPPTCYVYEDDSEHEFSTAITDAEGHFETPIAINSPIDKIWYSAKKSSLGYNYFVVQYSTDNGTTWSTVSSPDLGSDYEDYSASFPTMSGNKKITHVRFGAKTGATLSKWYKNVKISRKAYFNIQDAEHKNISSLPTMMCTIDETSTATAKFYIDYSTCAEEILIQSSNPEHFTVSETKIDITANSDNVNSAKEITVTYNSAELGTHNAVITIKTDYQTRALSVSGETTKRTPILTWQEGFTNNPLTLPVGLVVNAIKPAAVSTSPAAVMYESSNENVIEIIDEGLAFRVIGLGDATLTAIVPENDKWKTVSGTRTVHATEKTVQEIIWDQSFPRFMNPGDVIDLDAKVYLRHISTNSLTYSAERTQNIAYSCPVNNVVAINGKQMTILGYGEVRVSASVSGNADYEASVPVTMLINVRKPSNGCETPLVVNHEDIIDMFEVNVDFSNYTNLTTQEMISDEIAINQIANGKPDKLSFSYGGEAYKVPVINTELLGGYIKFEQFVGTEWKAVDGSRVETEKNAWNTKSNLQLDENATALRIIREAGGTGHHKLKDIQVTRKQYLRAITTEFDLGEIVKGESKSILVKFDYSDIKGDLTAHMIEETSDVTFENNGAIDLECGSFGRYELPVTFTPSAENDNWEGTIEIYDNIANLSTTVVLRAKVTVTANDVVIFRKEGEWSNPENWSTITQTPGEEADIIVPNNQEINVSASVNSMTIYEGVTVTIKSGKTLQIGSGTPKTDKDFTGKYGNLYVEDGGSVIIAEGGTLNVQNFTIEASKGGNGTPASSGQVGGEGAFNVSGDVYFDLALDPTGECSQGWYDFSVPFPVDVMTGISRFDNMTGEEKTIKNEVNYAIMDFSESRHVQSGYGWKKYRDVMEPGKCYSITIDDVDNVYRFKKTQTGELNRITEATLAYTESELNRRGWNGMGNGTLAHVDLSAMGYGEDPNDQPKVQLYSHSGNSYFEAEIDEFTYVVGASFFIQARNDESVVNYAQHNDANPDKLQAPKRFISNGEFRLSLKQEDADKTADRLYVSAIEDAIDEYEIGRDLTKFGTPTEAKVAQVWAEAYGLKLCDVEQPLVDNKASITLGLFAPQAGRYTLSVDRAQEDATLYLTYNNRVIWNLSIAPYVFDLTQGTTEGFGLRLVNAPKVSTDFENADVEGQTVRKVMIDDIIYLVTPDGKMYDIVGKGIKF